MEVEKKVIEIVEEITESEGFEDMKDEDLFEEGIFDSLSFLELIAKIEEKFGIKLETTQVEREELSSIDRIKEFVEKRLNE